MFKLSEDNRQDLSTLLDDLRTCGRKVEDEVKHYNRILEDSYDELTFIIEDYNSALADLAQFLDELQSETSDEVLKKQVNTWLDDATSLTVDDPPLLDISDPSTVVAENLEDLNLLDVDEQ